VHTAQGAVEAQKRATMVVMLLNFSTVVLETNLIKNCAMVALNLAFNSYINNILEASNCGSIS